MDISKVILALLEFWGQLNLLHFVYKNTTDGYAPMTSYPHDYFFPFSVKKTNNQTKSGNMFISCNKPWTLEVIWL